MAQTEPEVFLKQVEEAPEPPIRLPEVPLDFGWRPPAESWNLSGGILTIRAGAATDLFVDPGGTPAVLTAPRLLASLVGDFLLSARVTVEFVARFDAGALLIHVDAHRWAKLCFEYAPRNEPTVVSVVTRGVSDDCNSYPTPSTTTWLRVARRGSACAFHSSADGNSWKLVRHFALGPADEVAAGFVAQSPEGAGCTVRFDRIRLRRERLSDLRNGQ